MQRRRRSHLEGAISKKLENRRSHATIRSLTNNDRTSVDFSSNDFLSLASSSELREIYLQELHNGLPNASLGSGGSRLLDGNSPYAERLEKDIADFHGAESGLLCNSGFDANVGVFSCLPQPGDIIVYDEFIHASVHDGMRLSQAAKTICFAHNDVSALRSVLQQCSRDDDAVLHGARNVFVAVESVYSMDGDIAPLTEIVDLLSELLPERNGHLIVDEAHSTGIYGSQGRGIICELGLEDQILVRLHTFGKALAANGAILLCSPLVRQYFINYARPLIYTTFMSYPALAAIRASYTYLMQGKTEPLAQNLKMLNKALHDRLLDLQDSLYLTPDTQNLLQVPSDCPKTPIYAAFTSEPKSLAAHCQSEGFIVRGIVPPTVPIGAERIRICLHAGNTIEQIDGLISAIRGWVTQKVRDHESIQPARARL